MIARNEIIVVEDNDGVRQSIDHLLEHSGYESRSYATAEELLETEIGQPSLMIFDIRLAGQSGLSLLKFVRSQGLEVPAILISGNFDTGVDYSLQFLPNTVCLQKPFLPEEFLEVIERMIRSRQGCTETV